MSETGLADVGGDGSVRISHPRDTWPKRVRGYSLARIKHEEIQVSP